MKLARAVCTECAKELPVRPPMGGDGSVDVFPRHERSTVGYSRITCEGSRQEVPAESYVEAP